MSCIPSAAYKIIRARCTIRNGNVTVLARRASSARSRTESSITYVLALGTTHNSPRPPRTLPIVRRISGRVHQQVEVVVDLPIPSRAREQHATAPALRSSSRSRAPSNALAVWIDAR